MLQHAVEIVKKEKKTQSISSSLRPGITCGKWFIGYNFGINDGAESQFRTHKELIVLNILEYKYRVNKSRDMSRDHFAKNRKLLTSWWPVWKTKSSNDIFLIHIKYF